MKKWILLSLGGLAFRWIQKQMRGRPAERGQRNW
jgi:hypothetical protein